MIRTVLHGIYHRFPVQFWDGLERRTPVLRKVLLFSMLRRLPRPLETIASGYLEVLWWLWGNRGFSASPDYLQAMVGLLRRTSGNVAECGSGLSTLMGGLSVAGTTREWVALEQDPQWACQLKSTVERLGLTQTCVAPAPLCGFESFDWYRVDWERLPGSIELIVCDGPPASTRGGRVGVLPVLADRLCPRSWLLLDDADRPGEQEALAEWKRIFPDWTFTIEQDAGGWKVIRIDQS